MGRHTAPGERPAQQQDPRKKSRTPRAASVLPLAAVVLTGLAGAGSAAAGASQAVADTDTPDTSSQPAVTQTLSHRGQPAPASREHRVALGAPDARQNPRSTPPRRQPSPVTATGHCVASYYDTGSVTANGEPFDTGKMTAANKALPFDTRVKVIDDTTKQSVVVRINDRGPYVAGRCLDLTPTAMRALAGPNIGMAHVTYQVLGKK